MLRRKHVLFTVEIEGAFIPPRHGLPAAVERAADALLSAAGGEELDPAAVTQGQTVGRDESDAAGVDVSGVEHPRRLVRVVREELELGPDTIRKPAVPPAVILRMGGRVHGREDQIDLRRPQFAGRKYQARLFSF
jgi:hypothetical protein